MERPKQFASSSKSRMPAIHPTGIRCPSLRNKLAAQQTDAGQPDANQRQRGAAFGNGRCSLSPKNN
jgi:hypothetical protein